MPDISLVTIPNVELLETGDDWNLSTGVWSVTPEDLASAITSQEDPAVRTPIVKLGHVDPRFDGQPSLGRIENLRTTNEGNTLVGDLVGVPVWLASVAASAYPRRSIEGWVQWETRTGNTWPFVLTGLAMLGDAYPAIETLEDLEMFFGDTVPTLYPVDDVAAIAAATPHAQQVVATRVVYAAANTPGTAPGGTEETVPKPVLASVAVEDVRRAYYDSLDEGQYWWWVRAVLIDPTELIVDDDEGGLYRVPFATSGDAVTFSEPEAVKVEYVSVAAGALAVAASAPRLPVATGQQVGAAFTSPGAAGRPKHASATTPEAVPEGSGTVPGTESDSIPNPKENGMDAAQRATLLGVHKLPATATDEEIMAAVVAAVQTVTDGSDPGDDGNPVSQPEVPATDPAASPATAPGTETTPAETPQPVAKEPSGLTLPEGMVVIDQTVLDQLLEGNKAAGELVSAAKVKADDEYIASAVRAGKFSKSDAPKYRTLLAKSPETTRSVIDVMARLLPVTEVGASAGSNNDDVEAGDQSAYPASWGKTVSASRRGSASRIKVVGD